MSNPIGNKQICILVIVNEKSLNLEKTTSSAQSVLLLIYVQKEIEILGFFE